VIAPDWLQGIDVISPWQSNDADEAAR